MPAQPIDVHVLGIIMNKKIIVTLMAACLIQACTKNESTEGASSNPAKQKPLKLIQLTHNSTSTKAKVILQPMVKKLCNTFLIRNTLIATQPFQSIMLDSCVSNLLIFFFTHGTFDSWTITQMMFMAVTTNNLHGTRKPKILNLR